jgi:hypothetical protein
MSVLGESSAAAAAGAGPSVAAAQASQSFMIAPDHSGAKLNTADWPLLLKNYVSAAERGKARAGEWAVGA